MLPDPWRFGYGPLVAPGVQGLPTPWRNRVRFGPFRGHMSVGQRNVIHTIDSGQWGAE